MITGIPAHVNGQTEYAESWRIQRDRDKFLGSLVTAAGYQTELIGKTHWHTPEDFRAGFEHVERLTGLRKKQYLLAGRSQGIHGLGWNEVDPSLSTYPPELYSSDWIGGQFTSQAVPPDESGWIEQFGSTASYRRFRNHIRDHYRRFTPLKPEVAAYPFFNPGNGWVSPLCHEPRVALSVLEAMLATHETAGRLTLWRETVPVAADTDGDVVVKSVTLRNVRNGTECRVEAHYVIDATENGDLLPLAGAEHVTGAEARADTGEADAKEQAEPDNVQAFSFCFVVDHDPHADHVGKEPDDYGFWKQYQPPLDPPWPGPWLGWQGLHPRTMEPFSYHFDPTGEPAGPFGGLWGFRRILDRRLFADGAYPSDLCLVNWPMLDYVGGHLLTPDTKARQEHLDAARRQSRALFSGCRPRPRARTMVPAGPGCAFGATSPEAPMA